MIEIKNVTKTYGKGEGACRALDDISVTIPDNKFTAITGKSGCGKTTLLNMLGLVDTPDSGQIFFDGKDILQFKGKEIQNFRRRSVGIVFQFFNLIPVINVYDNIMIANRFAPKCEAEYFRELTERLEISELLRKYPDELSGGQRQKTAIARALINRPGTVLADEPTGNLDSESTAKVARLLKEVTGRYGITLVTVTHDKDIAEMADVNIHMSDGKIIS